MVPSSERLVFRRLTSAELGAFHSLATDPHIRRFLLDGQTVSRSWCDEVLGESDALFESRNVGLWLVAERRDSDRFIGFCGFHIFEDVEPDPELMYAFIEDVTGKGYATEAGEALIRYARDVGLRPILSAVDEPNVASVRVLQKLGFEEREKRAGAFGHVILFAFPDLR